MEIEFNNLVIDSLNGINLKIVNEEKLVNEIWK